MIKIIERGKYEQVRCNGCNALLRFNWADVSERWTIKCPCCQYMEKNHDNVSRHTPAPLYGI